METTGILSTQWLDKEVADGGLVQGTLEAVVEEMSVAVVEALEDEEVAAIKSLMVWILEIQIYYLPTKNGRICLFRQGVSCNIAMKENAPSIR